MRKYWRTYYMIDLETLQWILISALIIICTLLGLYIQDLRMSFDLLESLVMQMSDLIDHMIEVIKNE